MITSQQGSAVKTMEAIFSFIPKLDDEIELSKNIHNNMPKIAENNLF
jgi:hypothetical protein